MPLCSMYVVTICDSDYNVNGLPQSWRCDVWARLYTSVSTTIFIDSLFAFKNLYNKNGFSLDKRRLLVPRKLSFNRISSLKRFRSKGKEEGK